MNPVHPTLEPIEQAVCEAWDVTPVQLRGKSKLRHIVEARHAYVRRMYQTHLYSITGLAMVLGVAPGTIVHSIQKARALCEVDSTYNAKYQRLQK